MTLLLKDPEALLNYSVDWGADYLAGDVLTESSWTVSPAEAGGVSIISSRFNLHACPWADWLKSKRRPLFEQVRQNCATFRQQDEHL